MAVDPGLRFEVTGRYDVVLIDPPWHYYGPHLPNVMPPVDGYTGSGAKWGAAAKFYPTMTDEQIAAIPVRDWLEPRSMVFVWATGPRLDSAVDAIRAWGLHYRGTSFVWVKTKQDGVTLIGAQGVRPSVVKPTTEFVLAASTVKRGRPLPVADESVRQVMLAARSLHSVKPEAVQDRIDALYPGLRKAEVFARRRRDGWDCYGENL